MSFAPRASERGAVLIQVAIVMLGLTGLLIFVVDYGILWVSRSQAQNAADAGALAAAVALAFDPDEPSDFDAARVAAYELAAANPVFGALPAVEVQFNLRPAGNDPCVGFSFPVACEDEGASCTLVCVYRNQAHSNPLPMWIGPLVSPGLVQQGITAGAVAWARPANASRCLRPLAIADRWTGWDPTSSGEFDPISDLYSPPGFRVAFDVGQPTFELEPNDLGTIRANSFLPVDMTASSDPAEYERTIRECADILWRVGDALPVLPAGSLGGDISGTAEAARAIVGRDVVVPVFDPRDDPGDGFVTIINLLTLRIEGVDENERIVVRITTGSDLWLPQHNVNVVPEAAFVKAIQLVR